MPTQKAPKGASVIAQSVEGRPLLPRGNRVVPPHVHVILQLRHVSMRHCGKCEIGEKIASVPQNSKTDANLLVFSKTFQRRAACLPERRANVPGFAYRLISIMPFSCAARDWHRMIEFSRCALDKTKSRWSTSPETSPHLHTPQIPSEHLTST